MPWHAHVHRSALSRETVVVVACAGFAHLRAGRHEVLEGLRDGLVVDVELVFERVELGLVEDSCHHLAFEGRGVRRAARASTFPKAGWARYDGGGALLETHGQGDDAAGVVPRPDVAPAERRDSQGQNGAREERRAEPAPPPAVATAKR